MKIVPESAASGSLRLPSLDGWRAISILMVLGMHARRLEGFPKNLPLIYDWIMDGDLGVRFFFIISGFLITWLMLTEQARTGKVSLKNFYVRRSFRILPVLIAFLAILFLFQCFTPYSQTPREWLANVTFTTNFTLVPWPSRHLWSLAVEEQFYLLWPILFVVLGLATNWRASAKVLLAAMAVAPVIRWLAFVHFYPASLALIFEHLSFFKYFDSLAVGCGCAMAIARCPEAVRFQLDKFSNVIPFGATGLILLPDILYLDGTSGRLVAAIGPSVQAFGFALLLLQSTCFPQLWPYRWLNWAVVRHLGVLSYSLYIWQQIFFTQPSDFGLASAWWLRFPEAFVMIALVACVSYFGLERPFLNLRARFRDQKSPDNAAVSSLATGQPKDPASSVSAETVP